VGGRELDESKADLIQEPAIEPTGSPLRRVGTDRLADRHNADTRYPHLGAGAACRLVASGGGRMRNNPDPADRTAEMESEKRDGGRLLDDRTWDEMPRRLGTACASSGG
jgi:hypothetical protein